MAIIECYQRRELSVEEVLIEMYEAGVLVRRLRDITQAFGVQGSVQFQYLAGIVLRAHLDR